ncbi:MAG TPA: hypothetical protein PLK77_09585 [Pyrinomonadaceae bacterium]|nr:hypothetical protein [Pyrinomonadaceae bacterium]
MNNLDHAPSKSAGIPPETSLDHDSLESHQDGKNDVADLLQVVLDAHGGYERWKKFEKVSSQVVSGGFLWAMKGIPIDNTPRTMMSEFRRQWSCTDPFGEAEWHMTFTPDRVAIETASGEIIAEQRDPRDTFSDHHWDTPWTPLQLGYFNGYAMWTYYNLPFLLGEPGFALAAIPPLIQDGVQLTGIKVGFPQTIHTHSREQNLYFEEGGLLCRQDYSVDVAGGAKAAHLISDYVDVGGLKFATKRRVYMRNEDDSLQLDQMPVSIDLSDFELS